jgi:general stress protein 26
MAVPAEQHLYDLITDLDTAMVVTHRGGQMHARPMAVAQLRPDADSYFATSLECAKVREIEADANVAILFQSGSRFAAVQGTAKIVTDKALIEQLWSETWRLWFPDGKDDPSLCLLKVEATAGEYWDRSGMKSLQFLFEGWKAAAQGRTPEIAEPERHGRVTPGQRRG